MSDARILHKKAGGSEKVAGLADLDYRVWTQYLVSADDYGVMPATAAVLQADNRRLRKLPARAVQAALERVIASGLVLTFEHQGERFVWQPDWVSWQTNLRHPRFTVHPAPPVEVIEVDADAKTLEFFRNHHANVRAAISERFPKSSGNSSEVFQPLAGAGGRETLTLTRASEGSGREESARETQADPPVWRAGSPTRRSGLVGNHTACFFAPVACARGICIPAFLGQQWRQQLTESEAGDAEIQAFVSATLVALPAGPIGDDPLKFWRAAWAARHGLQAPAPPPTHTKGARAVHAFDAAHDAMEQRRGQS